MTDENSLALRQADQARADVAALESEIEVLQAQLALLPTRKELARLALLASTSGAALTTVLMLIFLR
jgi:hypothetical protein